MCCNCGADENQKDKVYGLGTAILDSFYELAADAGMWDLNKQTYTQQSIS